MHVKVTHTTIIAIDGSDSISDFGARHQRDRKVTLEEAHCWTVAAQKASDQTIIVSGSGPVDLYMSDGIQGETFLLGKCAQAALSTACDFFFLALRERSQSQMPFDWT